GARGPAPVHGGLHRRSDRLPPERHRRDPAKSSGNGRRPPASAQSGTDNVRSITIAGSMAQRPGRGGHTWVFLQYLLGFRKLGWDVLFLDRLEHEMCHDDSGTRVPIETPWNVRDFCDEMQC